MMKPDTSVLHIRKAERDDAPLVLKFIQGLAEYERLSHECQATLAQLEATVFAENSVAEVVMAFRDGQPAGFALFFRNYSTFLAKPGLYLEDLFVDPVHRGFGVGQALLAHLAAVAVERGYGRFEWSVLDWNESAIRFYTRLGAKPMNDWTVYRVTGDALEALAASSMSARQ